MRILEEAECRPLVRKRQQLVGERAYGSILDLLWGKLGKPVTAYGRYRQQIGNQQCGLCRVLRGTRKALSDPGKLLGIGLLRCQLKRSFNLLDNGKEGALVMIRRALVLQQKVRFME